MSPSRSLLMGTRPFMVLTMAFPGKHDAACCLQTSVSLLFPSDWPVMAGNIDMSNPITCRSVAACCETASVASYAAM